MLDGTRPYRRKNSTPPPQETPAEIAAPVPETPRAELANPDRRAWMNSLLPALGAGLVEILRTSNNLKRDLHEAIKKDAE